MISLSAGEPSIEDEARRPLTLDELEALHGLEPASERIPGAARTLPWARLTLVFAICALAGFALPLAAAHIGVDVTTL